MGKFVKKYNLPKLTKENLNACCSSHGTQQSPRGPWLCPALTLQSPQWEVWG